MKHFYLLYVCIMELFMYGYMCEYVRLQNGEYENRYRFWFLTLQWYVYVLVLVYAYNYDHVQIYVYVFVYVHAYWDVCVYAGNVVSYVDCVYKWVGETSY